MMYNIYKKGNYLIVDEQGNDFLVEAPVKEVQIEKLDSDKDIYQIKVGNRTVFDGHLSLILNADDEAYSSEQFDAFRLNV